MSQTGRNAPCPCGSGKKYKKCCLPKEAEKPRPQKTYRDYCLEVADSLRAKILEFMKKAGHDRFIEEAFEEYWRTLEPDLDPPELSEPGYLGFLEWYIHDYPIPEHERPVIELFLESNPLLPAEEMQVLKDWQDAHLSVYQIKEVRQKEGVLAEDIFTREEVFISDISLSLQARKWELITTRIVKVLDEWQASSIGSKEDPKVKGEIYDFVMAAFQLFRKYNRGLKLPNFLREMGFMLHQRFLTLQARPPELPKVMTSSGEEITFWEARYDLADLPNAVARLESQVDFAESEWEEDDNGEILKIFFDWLESGKSARKSKSIRRQSGMKLDSLLLTGPGNDGVRLLGTVILEPGRAILEVKGEKRFALGKKRLEAVLAGLLEHRLDTVKSLAEMLRDNPPDKTLEDIESGIPPDIQQALLKDMLDQHYQKWLDTPLPALSGKTPRKAIKTATGLRRVEDLLRSLEYHHQENMKYDIAWIRRELDL